MPKPFDIQPRHIEAIGDAMAEVHAVLAANLLVANDGGEPVERQQLLGNLMVRVFQSFLQKAHGKKQLSPEVSTYTAAKAFIAKLHGYDHSRPSGNRQQLTAALKAAIEALQLEDEKE